MNGRPLLAKTALLLVLALSAPAGLAAAAPSPSDPSPGARQVTFRVTVQGHENQPSATGKKPLTLVLKHNATSQITLYNVIDTSQDGFFTVAVSGKDGESITWRIKSDQTLAAAGTFLLGDFDYLNMGNLLTGDANNDNVVNKADLNILMATYGKSPGDKEYDARADFNGDDAVTLIDRNLLVSNMEKSGANELP